MLHGDSFESHIMNILITKILHLEKLMVKVLLLMLSILEFILIMKSLKEEHHMEKVLLEKVQKIKMVMVRNYNNYLNLFLYFLGTHCSGILAGSKYGVSKKAKVVGVRVLDANGSGSTSGVLKGIEWVVNQHKSNQKSKSVASMSLGGGYSRVLNAAVNNAVDAGVFFVVAAGNEANNACNSSPASAVNAITVGATDIDDNLAWFSNTGSCVNILAPGVEILSAWIGNRKSTNVISGTSMSTPFIRFFFIFKSN